LHAARRVHQHQHQVAGFKRLVNLLQHAAIEVRTRLVHARSIHKHDLRRRVHTLARGHLNHSRDAIASGLRLGRHNGYFFACQGIQ
jgi:hypothetical protein